VGLLGLPAHSRGAFGSQNSKTSHPIQGKSLVSYFKGGSAPKRESFYWELHEGRPIQAVRFGNWKAVRNGPNAPIELYDLTSDPSEAHNVAAVNPDLVAKADTLMKQSRVDDPNWPLPPKAKKAPGGKKPAKAKQG
jgi:arylsulfatase A